MVRASARQRELGQNFLVDNNILDVIERLAGVAEGDVVLEVGGGEGVLSQRLARSASFLHLIELDQRLREGLERVLADFDDVNLVFGDATRVDLGALTPPPTKMVANLPYGVAATVILRTVADLPTMREWVVMVQREVGERFAAGPGTSAYGVPSVLAQLCCEVKVLRPISRQVFRPVPNVDSVLLGLRRRDGAAGEPVAAGVSTLVHGAFAHRRKALAGSLALSLPGGVAVPDVDRGLRAPPAGARPADGPGVRERAREAVAALGHPADVRAERLAPDEFRALWEALA